MTATLFEAALGIAPRQTNGFLEAINGLFQAGKRRARSFNRIDTIKTVIFLIAGNLDFHAINSHAGQPT
jgi:transposase